MSMKLLSFDNKSDIREFLLVRVVSYALEEPVFARWNIGKLRARVGVKDVDIFEIVLSITATNDKEPTVNKSF